MVGADESTELLKCTSKVVDRMSPSTITYIFPSVSSNCDNSSDGEDAKPIKVFSSS